MPIQLTTVEDAFYAVLHADTAGASVRALLVSGGAACVIRVEDLIATSLPHTPFIAMGVLDLPGKALDMRTFLFEWYAYDDELRRYSRINPILEAIEGAYTFESLPYGQTDMVGPISRPFTDQALARRCRRMRFSFTTRR